MTRRGRAPNLAVVIAIAWLLVVQGVVAGILSVAGANPARAAGWDDPLCIGSAAHTPDHSAPARKLPPCCSPGCWMLLGPQMAAAPDGAGIAAPLRTVLAAMRADPPRVAVVARGRRPGNPRAPPAA